MGPVMARHGHLTTSLAEKPPATAFAVGIRRFGMLITRLTVSMVLFVLVVNISFHRPLLESLIFALALAVGLTPELLPMIVTVTLARSAIELSKRKVIVKRLSAIHDLGAMNVLCISLITILFIFYGFYQGIYRAVGKAFAADFVPEHLRASGIGWYGTTVGLLQLVASIVAGLLWDRIGHAAVFYYGAVFAVISSIGLLVLIPDKRDRRIAGTAK